MSGTHSLKPIDEGEEMTAVITEAQRFEMHTCLRGLMGEEVANTMMEHLPPSGWSDVARKSDVIQIQKDIDRLQGEIHSVRNSVWSSLGITASIMLGQMALILFKIP